MFNFEGLERGMPNLTSMMRRLGIDGALLALHAEGTAIGSVIRACAACPRHEACRIFLERADARFEVAPLFCPNRERFAQARRVATLRRTG
jgi:hypothetical protein